ncbi:MAG: potassium-transporting ATPase subunit KdpA, partial [Acidobacteria bacterium]
MTVLGVAQILIFFLVVLAVTKPLGAFMTRVFEGERTFLHPVLGPVERLVYRLGGVREEVDQRWTEYAASLLSFSLFSFVTLYALERLQAWLPLNPQRLAAITPDSAFNTAVSFMTNTNW